MIENSNGVIKTDRVGLEPTAEQVALTTQLRLLRQTFFWIVLCAITLLAILALSIFGMLRA